MAGTVTHLVIADRLLEHFDIKNPALFYCGNLAPDAVMARKNYVREMKKHTHFKDGIPTNDLHLPENYKLYRSRLAAFRKQFLRKDCKDYELYLGYVVHMLADEVFILTLRDRHVKKLVERGEDPHNPAYFKKFGEDVDYIDRRLAFKYPFRYQMPDTLLQVNDYEIKGYITREELIESKQFIIQKNFGGQYEKRNTTVLSFEENENFIQNAVSAIISEL
jgi:hypothetical protein